MKSFEGSFRNLNFSPFTSILLNFFFPFTDITCFFSSLKLQYCRTIVLRNKLKLLKETSFSKATMVMRFPANKNAGCPEVKPFTLLQWLCTRDLISLHNTHYAVFWILTHNNNTNLAYISAQESPPLSYSVPYFIFAVPNMQLLTRRHLQMALGIWENKPQRIRLVSGNCELKFCSKIPCLKY